MDYRTEQDHLGSKKVPSTAYYGIQTMRAKNNFEVIKEKQHKQFIRALAIVKKSAAEANANMGLLDEDIARAIEDACDEVLAGKFQNQFITSAVQGGAGTSMNMNINEVLANRANEILGGKLGKYDKCHPVDHVNFGQSTNDVIQTSFKIATIYLTRSLIVELQKLNKAYLDKANDLKDDIKIGRTHLQEACPISLGQVFKSYSGALERDIERLDDAMNALRSINMGATAIGTGLNANEDYIKEVVYLITKNSRIQFMGAKDLVDATANLDTILHFSSVLNTIATNLNKVANDLKLMASGPVNGFNEIILPEVQAGCAIIPAKVNPVIPETVSQACFLIEGNHMSITRAISSSELELNVYMPLIIYKVFENLDVLKDTVNAFRKKCVQGIEANKKSLEYQLDHSPSMITALVPHLGYEKCEEIANISLETGKSIKEVILEMKLMTKKDVDKLLDPKKMIKTGIVTI